MVLAVQWLSGEALGLGVGMRRFGLIRTLLAVNNK